MDVKKDRDKYIGGSDIPIIMNISSFRTRWELLLEKAGLETSDFEGNRYTEYGNVMEPKIRDHINEAWKRKFKPATKIINDLRGNTDGYDGKSILEIKTTSRVGETLSDYKHYLVQLLFYMYLYKAKSGMLAVYARPEDFSEEFDAKRLQTFVISADEYADETAAILSEIQVFQDDLDYLNDYPLSDESDLPSRHSLTPYVNAVCALEERLLEFKTIKEQYEEAKEVLLHQMLLHNVTVWTTPNNIRIAAVQPGEDKLVRKLNEKKLKEEKPELWEEYAEDKIQKGKAGYVRITYPKT